jgi:hypothetical protein
MKLKKNTLYAYFILFSLFFLTGGLAHGQSNVFFDYDESGNRVCKRMVQCLVFNNNDPFYESLMVADSVAELNVNEVLNEETLVWENEAIQDGEFWTNYYPNPTRDKVTIEWRNADYTKQGVLYDERGKVIHRFFVEGDVYEMDLSHLSSGTYLVLILSERKNQILKILKQ